MIQVQAVDKERAAVDDCLQKRKNPGVATPGEPRDIPVGENDDSVSRVRRSVKKSLQMSTFCDDRRAKIEQGSSTRAFLTRLTSAPDVVTCVRCARVRRYTEQWVKNRGWSHLGEGGPQPTRVARTRTKYVAYERTRRCSSGSVEKLTAVLADSQVDLNPHQVEAALFGVEPPRYNHLRRRSSR